MWCAKLMMLFQAQAMNEFQAKIQNTFQEQQRQNEAMVQDCQTQIQTMFSNMIKAQQSSMASTMEQAAAQVKKDLR